MEYIYVAMLLHKLGKPVNEENVKKVLSLAGLEKKRLRNKFVGDGVEVISLIVSESALLTT